MITKKKIVIIQYLKMNNDLQHRIKINLFPHFVDVINLIFYYYYYYYIDSSEHVQ